MTDPRDRRTPVKSRKGIREIVRRLWSRGGSDEMELARDWLPGEGAAGARRSVTVPRSKRAIVDVIATIET